MDLSKKIFAVLAILCIVASAGVVCASEDGDGAYAGSNYDDRGGWAGSNYEDHGGWAGSNYQDNGGWAGSQYNETANSQNHTAAGAPVNSTGHNVTTNKTAYYLFFYYFNMQVSTCIRKLLYRVYFIYLLV